MTSTPTLDRSTPGAQPSRPERPGLAELVARLRPATTPADPGVTACRVADVLQDLLDDGALTTDLLTAAERAGSADSYVRHLLHAEPTFSVMALVWRPGQRTEIHDHLVWCTFAVLQGHETETLYRADGDRVRVVGEQERPPGSVSGAAPPDDIHRVTNAHDEVAITLHVYGADLTHGTSVRRLYADPPA